MNRAVKTVIIMCVMILIKGIVTEGVNEPISVIMGTMKNLRLFEILMFILIGFNVQLVIEGAEWYQSTIRKSKSVRIVKGDDNSEHEMVTESVATTPDHAIAKKGYKLARLSLMVCLIGLVGSYLMRYYGN